MDLPELDMVVLTTCPLVVARIIEGFLEDSGIQALVSEGYPWGAPAIVRVPASRLSDAQRVLADAENSNPSPEE